MRTNPRTLPPVYWASATAASLPDTSRSPFIRASSWTFLCFGSTPTAEPGVWRARGAILTRSCGPCRSTTIRGVFIFVRLAIARRRVGLSRQSTRPVRTSNISPALGGWLKRRRTRSGVDSFTANLESPPPAASSGGGCSGAWARLSGRTCALSSFDPPPPPEEPIRIAASAIAPTIGIAYRRRRKRGRRSGRPDPRPRLRPERKRERRAPPVRSRGRSSLIVGRRPEQAADHRDGDHDKEEERYHGQDVKAGGCDHADGQRGKQHYERQDGYQGGRLHGSPRVISKRDTARRDQPCKRRSAASRRASPSPVRREIPQYARSTPRRPGYRHRATRAAPPPAGTAGISRCPAAPGPAARPGI